MMDYFLVILGAMIFGIGIVLGAALMMVKNDNLRSHTPGPVGLNMNKNYTSENTVWAEQSGVPNP